MDVRELNEDQLTELKLTYYYEDIRVRDKYYYYWDIPDEVIYDRYSGICFVNDDFFCSAN